MSRNYLQILLIEDNPTDQDLFKEFYDETSFSPSTLTIANSLREGLKILFEKKTDILLLDLSMPDSFELTGLKNIKNEDVCIDFIPKFACYILL